MANKKHTLVITENEEMYDVNLLGEGLIEINDGKESSTWYLTSLDFTDEVKLGVRQVDNNNSIEDVVNGTCKVKLAYVMPEAAPGSQVNIPEEAILIDMGESTAFISVNEI
jgi:hypothetical protein